MPACVAGILGQEVGKRDLNTEAVPTPVFRIPITQHPAHSHPPLLCYFLWSCR